MAVSYAPIPALPRSSLQARLLLGPSGLSLEVLQANPRDVRVPLKTAYEKCRDAGFATPSGKIEIFSTVLLGIGEPPLPEFRAPEELAAPWNKSRVRES
jgi:hypothetical protein